MQTIADLKQAHRDHKVPFALVLLLKKVALRKARNDSEFLMVELGDRTGVFHVVCFENSANYALFSSLPEGSAVRVEGHTAYYQERFSPVITSASLVPEEQLPDLIEALVESSPLPIDGLREELDGFVASMTDEGLRQTVQHALREVGPSFFLTPGAIAMHHAYRGGLLEHTVRMARACRALQPLYPEVDADLAMAGIILHDIGKCLEYEGKLSTRRSRQGILQGHVVLGYRIVRRAAIQAKLAEDLLERLEHIILSHQGEPEWGAAVRAATPEAVFVSMVDNLDAKMGMVQQALRVTPFGETFSENVPGLMAPVMVKPPRSEETTSESAP